MMFLPLEEEPLCLLSSTNCTSLWSHIVTPWPTSDGISVLRAQMPLHPDAILLQVLAVLLFAFSGNFSSARATRTAACESRELIFLEATLHPWGKEGSQGVNVPPPQNNFRGHSRCFLGDLNRIQPVSCMAMTWFTHP